VSNTLEELRGAIRLMADNFSPTQPRDARGRFASTGGGRVALPIGISKEQRAKLTTEERSQWNKGWNEIAKLKRAAKAENDPAKALQHTLRVEVIMAKLKDIRAAADARLKGGGSGQGGAVQKKHGEDDKKQQKEVEDHAKKGGGAKKDVVSTIFSMGAAHEETVLIRDLRKEMSHLKGRDFDRAVLQAAESGQVFLHRFDHPGALSSKEKAQLIHSDGVYFGSVAVRAGQGGKQKDETKGDDQAGKQKGEKGPIDHEAEAQKMASALKDLAAGSGVDLIHLGALRGEMRHLSKEQFDQVIQHARRQGTITLTGAERGSGAPEFDKKHAIYEKDPVTGRSDTVLIYASLRGGHATGGGGVTTKSTDPPARDIHQALDMAHIDSKAAFGKYAIGGQLQPGNSIRDRLYALGGADTVAFDHIMTDPHLHAKAKEAVQAEDPGGTGYFHNEYFRHLSSIYNEWERGDKSSEFNVRSMDRLNKLEDRIKKEAVPALRAVGQGKMADFYEKHAPVIIEQLRRHFRGEDKGPKVTTRQSLTERLLNAPSAAGPAHSLSVVAKRAVQAGEMLKIMDEHSAPVGPVQRHGMSTPEEMHGMMIEGTHFQWSQATKDRASYAIAEIVQANTHQKIWDANKTVVLSAQKNKDDSHWEVAYDEPGFTSAATGGDGHVVGYHIDQHGMTADTFHHESGHNFAGKVWGNTSPLVYGPTYEGKASDGYARAQKKEKAVSAYGAKSPAEDFAEAVRLYSSAHYGQKEKLRKDFPLKYRAIEDLLGVPPAPAS
jgi:hypothetical protein